ncbi:MAG: PH domain-containing protein [Bacteroidota bacterium]
MKTELKKDEEIILETRKHWIVLVVPLIATVIVTIVGIYAKFATIIGMWGILAAILAISNYFYLVVGRKNNLWIVTNLRVIDEFGVFSSNSKESPLDKINNVSFSQSFWGDAFGYGNVQIQTAAEVGSTTYTFVEDPKKLKDTITHLQEEYKTNNIKKQASELANAIIEGQQNNNKTDISSEIEKLHELKQKGILTEEEYNNAKAKILNS